MRMRTTDHTRRATHRARHAEPIKAVRSFGRPLETSVRGTMESRFGHDFSSVRIHDDAHASANAQALGASAFTVGSDIVMNTDEVDLTSDAGTSVLAHELTHVVQNERHDSPSSVAPLSTRGDASELEAETAAHAVMSGETAQVSASPSALIARLEPPEPDRLPDVRTGGFGRLFSGDFGDFGLGGIKQGIQDLASPFSGLGGMLGGGGLRWGGPTPSGDSGLFDFDWDKLGRAARYDPEIGL